MKTVTRQRKKVSHGLHFVLTVVTMGTWLPVWIAVDLWVTFGPRDRVVTTSPRKPAREMTQSERIAARHAELVRKGKIKPKVSA